MSNDWDVASVAPLSEEWGVVSEQDAEGFEVVSQADDNGVTVGDYGRLVMKGGADLVKGLGYVTGLDAVEQAGRHASEHWREGLTPAMNAELSKEFISEDEDGNYSTGDAWRSPHAVGGMIAGSTLPMGLGMASGAVVSKGLQGLGMGAASSGVVGGAVGEGSISGTMAASEVFDRVMALPEDKLVNSEHFSAAFNGMPSHLPDQVKLEKAKEVVANAAATDAGVWSAVSTAVLGAPSGAAMGKLVKGETGNSLAGTVVKQGVLEGVVQEMPQSAVEQYTSNVAVREHADPSQRASEGVANAAAAGLVAGSAMGSGMGVPLHLSTGQKTLNSLPDDALPADDVIGAAPSDMADWQVTRKVPALPPAEIEANHYTVTPSGQARQTIKSEMPAQIPEPDNSIEYEPVKPDSPGLTLADNDKDHLFKAGTYENGIDLDANKALEINAPDYKVESERNAKRRVARASKISGMQDELGNVKPPEGLGDPRIKRLRYRNHLKSLLSLNPKESDPDNVTLEVDGLLDAVAKSGGVSIEDAKSQGIDPQHFKDAAGKRNPFRKDGLSFDAMAEALSQHGYMEGSYSANQLLEKMTSALSGEDVYSVGHDYDASDAASALAYPGAKPAQVKKAVEKALEGEKLGVGQVRIVSALMDGLAGKRVNQGSMESIKSELERARLLRKGARIESIPIDAYEDDAIQYAGDVYDDSAYDPELSGEGRALQEIIIEAIQVAPDAVDALGKKLDDVGANDLDQARAFYELIAERKANERGEKSTTESTAGGGSSAISSRGNPGRESDIHRWPTSEAESPREEPQVTNQAPADAGVSVSGDLFGGKDEAKTEKPESQKKAPTFSATHALPDGTKVRRYVDNGVVQENEWEDETGDIWEDDNAEYITTMDTGGRNPASDNTAGGESTALPLPKAKGEQRGIPDAAGVDGQHSGTNIPVGDGRKPDDGALGASTSKVPTSDAKSIFTVEKHGEKSVIAKGDQLATKERLEEAGINGGLWNAKHAGLVFPAKREGELRGVLVSDQSATKPVVDNEGGVDDTQQAESYSLSDADTYISKNKITARRSGREWNIFSDGKKIDMVNSASWIAIDLSMAAGSERSAIRLHHATKAFNTIIRGDSVHPSVYEEYKNLAGALDKFNQDNLAPVKRSSNKQAVNSAKKSNKGSIAEKPEAIGEHLNYLESAKLKEGQPGKSIDEFGKLNQAGQGSLEGVSTDQISRTEEQRPARKRTDAGGTADAPGNERSGGARLQQPGSVGDSEGALPVSEGGEPANRSRGKSGGRADAGGDQATKPDSSRRKRGLAKAADFVVDDSLLLGEGGQKTKARNNIAAVRLINELEESGRAVTRQDQITLAKYVGWGGIPQIFYNGDSVAKGWDKDAADLKALLSEEEYAAARRSTQDAHYTSKEIIDSIWSAIGGMGFKGGRVLEPSVGVGNFLGLMPTGQRSSSQITAVELDPITGKIAKYLYPSANIQSPVGFQDFTTPDNYFDVVVGNPPFGSQKLYDAKRKHLSKFSIHNYFFAKSIDALKPNGVLAMVVSNSLMDSAGDKARQYIADRSELMGAVRLPNNVFLKNAGTEVTTDIIFLRKLKENEKPVGESWMDIKQIKDAKGIDVPLNEYFERHPEMMLGEWGAFGSMYREDAPALVARDGQDTAALLADALANLPTHIMDSAITEIEPVPEIVIRDIGDAKVGSIFINADGILMIREEDRLGKAQANKVELKSAKAFDRVTGLVKVRDVATILRRAQLDEVSSEGKLNLLRKQLNVTYDRFVKSNGPINLDANKRLFRDDPTWPQLAALEDGFDRGISAAIAKRTGEQPRKPSAKKAAIFNKRTQSPYKAPESAKTAKDALVASLSQLGKVDMDYMKGLYGVSQDNIINELSGLVFENPVGGWEARDHYLSGNVKQKLAMAEAAAKLDARFNGNVVALREVQPVDIEAIDISVKPGAHWVPSTDVVAFVNEMTESSGSNAGYSPYTAKWGIEPGGSSASIESSLGTERVRAKEVITAALNGKQIVVRDSLPDKTTVLNEAATNAANEKVEKVKSEWGRWIWRDDERRERLSRLYNDTFNTDVLREYDGSHLNYPGKVSDDIIMLRPHQSNGVWRIVQSGTTLLDHVVGAGKTFTMISGAMELRRLGLAKKPMFVVPNHLVGQWAEDFIKLYPGASILAATKKDFVKGNRKRLFARIATGDYDAVIVAHSSFGKVEVDADYQDRFIKDQLKDIELAIETLRKDKGQARRSIKQAEKQRETLKEKLKKLHDVGNKDDNLAFGELGVDALFLDEAHEFKNLGFATGMTRIAGLGNPTGSQKAADLFMKTQFILERTGGRNVVFATGTPISNTMAEMFTMQRYLDYPVLKDQGIAHFDAWANMFGEVVSDWELSPSGQYKMNSRFSKFVNMPELMQRYLSFGDVINRDDINRLLKSQGKRLPVPKMKGGKPQNIVVDRSDDQADYIGEPVGQDANGNDQYPKGSLVHRAENLPKKPEKGADNMLKIMSDARKAALDMRLLGEHYQDDEGSKVNEAAGRIKDLYDKWRDDKGVQLVFIDLSTPKKAKNKEAVKIRDLIAKAEDGDGAAHDALEKISLDEIEALKGDFSVYDDLRQKLITSGIPDAEIAYIHDANTELQKEELFGKVRSGRIRVLFGSTAKMGAGMNVQNRLVALHHLDAPWRPSDLEQREGRIIRQGNELYERDPDGFEVEVLRYATKQTLDSRMWQTLETKARFIEQVRKGNVIAREIGDVGGEASNAAEMKAASSGNPLILEEMELRGALRKLEGSQAEHDREQFRIRDKIRAMESQAKRYHEKLPAIGRDAKKADKVPKDFTMQVAGKTYAKRKEAGAALLLQVAKAMKSRKDAAKVGKFAGFDMHVEPNFTVDALIVIEAEGGDLSVAIPSIEKADPQGITMKIANQVASLVGVPAKTKATISEFEKETPKLKGQLSQWDKADELAKVKARHKEVIEELKPKSKDDNGSPPDTPKLSKSNKPTSHGGLSVSEVEKAVGGIVRDWKGAPKINIVQSANKLPDSLKNVVMSVEGGKAEGVYDPRNGEVYLIADAIISQQRAQQVLFHETIGHYGLRKTFGDELIPILNRVYLSYGRSGLKGIADKYGFDLNDKVDRLMAAEEKLAQIAEQNLNTDGVTERTGLWRRFVEFVQDWLAKHGFIKMNEKQIRKVVADAGRRVKEGDKASAVVDGLAPVLSIKPDKNEVDETHKKQESLLKRIIKEGQPLDQAFKLMFKPLGINESGQFKLGKKAYDKFANAVEHGRVPGSSKAAGWVNDAILEKVRNGVMDRYGLDEGYIDADERRSSHERSIAIKGAELVGMLRDRGIDAKEAEVLQAILTGQRVADGDWNDIAEPVRKAIDELGREAVEYGLIDKATFEKNRATYLHRVYMKHEAEQTSLGGWVSKSFEARRKKLSGNALKGRGMSESVSMEKLLRLAPTTWWGRKMEGKADKALKDAEFIILDRLESVGDKTEMAPGMEEGGRKAKIKERIYWPAEVELPNKYGSWENRGTWKVRNVKGKDAVLWRDFTLDERTRMGEIFDARYTIGKTFHVMAHDLSVGKFYKDISANQAWAVTKEPPAGTWTTPRGRLSSYSEFSWVKVPDSIIPGSGRKKWGALANMYVRKEIWRDLNELDQLNTPKLWRTIMTQWKLNKTARNPVVHMNNVMSNLLFMDMADVRARDLVSGIQSIRTQDADYKEALENGAFGSSFVSEEIRRDVLQPLLDEIAKENQSGKGFAEGSLHSRISLLGRIADKTWSLLKKGDNKMLEYYQLEDEWFRMATYHRRRSLGDDAATAARVARDQFLNYNIRAPWVNVARETVLPFIAYTYRAVPVIARSIAERPWKLAKYAAVAYAAQALAYMLAPGDEEDERKSMRKEMQGDTWIPGVPRLVRLPGYDDAGNPLFLDIRRWIPAGDVFDMNQGQSALPIPAPLQFGGPIMLSFEYLLNKTAFTGKEITNELTDSPTDKLNKVADWAWKSWMPSAPWIPNSWYWDKIKKANNDGLDYYGRPYQLDAAILSSMGIKVVPQDVRIGLAGHGREIQKVRSALDFDAYKLNDMKRRKLISDDEYTRELESLKKKYKQLADKAKEFSE